MPHDTPSDFDHLDHVTNALIEAGVAKPCGFQCYLAEFSANKARVMWNIDVMKKLMGDLPPERLKSIKHAISVAEVIDIVHSTPAAMHVDREYARSIPPHKRRLPAYIVIVPDDVGAPREEVGKAIVVDGNHRVYAAYLDHSGLPAYIVPPEIEAACRIPVGVPS